MYVYYMYSDGSLTEFQKKICQTTLTLMNLRQYVYLHLYNHLRVRYSLLYREEDSYMVEPEVSSFAFC